MQSRPGTGTATRTTQQRFTSLLCLLALLAAPLLLCLSTPAHAMSMGHTHCSHCVHHAPAVQVDAHCCTARQQPPASTAVVTPEIVSPFTHALRTPVDLITTPSAAQRPVTVTIWHAPPLISLRI